MIFNNLVNKIYETDYDNQKELLTQIATDIRHLPSPNVLLNNKMFFVTDNDYLTNMVGDFIKDESLGMYHKGNCKGLFKLWIPIYDFNDDIVGFAWYSDGSIERAEDRPHIKYQLQTGTFIKRRFLNIRRHTYLQALKEGYLCTCDGFFDKYHLEEVGLLSDSTLGSDITEYRAFYLSFIKHHFLLMDNDEAGLKLAEQMKQFNPNSYVTIVKQSVGKDADDYLKFDPKNKFILKKKIEEARRCPTSFGELYI